MKKSMVFIFSAFIAMLGLAGFANTLTVTSLIDEFPTANNVLDTSALTQGTFRWALANSSEGDTIVFDDSIAGGTINMLSVKDVTPQQDTSFVIAHALTIEGNGVTINGGWNGVSASATGTRIFLTAAGQGKTTVKNLNLVNGHGANWYQTTEKFYLAGAINAGSPVRLENCRLVNNCTMDRNDGYSYPTIRGGGAISADSDLELVSCYFGTNCVPNGSSSYGGAICQRGGSLVVKDTVFDHDYTKSFGGGAAYLDSGVTSAVFRNCRFLENTIAGNQHGGAIRCEMSSGSLKLFDCAFRGCRGSSGQVSRGGAIWCSDKSHAELTAVGCEFSDCHAQFGAAVYYQTDKPSLFVNCTFSGNAAQTWAGAIETFVSLNFVNCTVVGEYCVESDGGGLYASAQLNMLNSVFAYNYGTASLKSSDGAQSGNTKLRSLYRGVSSASFGTTYTLASSMEDIGSATKLFADYEMVSDMRGYDTTRVPLPHAVVMPKLSGDIDSTRVVEIGDDSVLKSDGYPVRVNADYSYVEYSDDGGNTWKQFFKRDGADTVNLTMITADQRSVPYADGAVPIGAATVGGRCRHEHTTTNGYVAATCEGVGDTGLVTCDECGATLFDHEEIPALGHAWDAGSITTQPTCTEKGIKTYTCTRTGCDGTKTENVDELGHDWGEWVITKEPSKMELGLRERNCQRDGCSAREEETIPMIVDVAALRNLAVVTTIGTAPTLPAKVAGLKADGTVGGEYDVVWSGVTAPSAAGITTVTGTAQVNGAPMSVTAFVRAAAASGDFVNIAPLASSMTVDVDNADEINGHRGSYDIVAEAVNITNNWGGTVMKQNDWNTPNSMFQCYWHNHQGTNITVNFSWEATQRIKQIFIAERNGNVHTGSRVLKDGATGEEIPSTQYEYHYHYDRDYTYYKINQGDGFLYLFNQPLELSALTIEFTAPPDSIANGIYGIEIFAEGGSGSVDPLTTDTLSALAVDGNAVAGFAPTTYGYTVENGNEITSATSTDNVGITILQKSVTVSNNAYVVTLAEDGESTQKYTVAMPDVWESGTIIYLQ